MTYSLETALSCPISYLKGSQSNLKENYSFLTHLSKQCQNKRSIWNAVLYDDIIHKSKFKHFCQYLRQSLVFLTTLYFFLASRKKERTITLPHKKWHFLFFYLEHLHNQLVSSWWLYSPGTYNSLYHQPQHPR